MRQNMAQDTGKHRLTEQDKDSLDAQGATAESASVTVDIPDAPDDVLMAWIKGDESAHQQTSQSRTKAYDAFSVLVRRHNDRFYALAYRLLRNPQEAEDVVQDCFMKIWHKPYLWRGDKKTRFTTWFYTIVLNECRMRWRSAKNSAVSQYTQHEDTQDILFDAAAMADFRSHEHHIDAQRQHDTLQAGLNMLPERQKEALVLCFFEEMSNKDAAQIMGIKVKALESLLMRGKAGLREFIR